MHARTGGAWRRGTLATLLAAVTCGVAAAATPPDGAEVQFRIAEPALMDLLRAVTPHTLTVGTSPLSADLVLSDPRDLVLKDGKASFTIRVKGRTLPVEQVLSPTLMVSYDQQLHRYFVVVSSLPLRIPGLGSIDLKEYFPRLEIPALLENLWKPGERPLGLNLRIRKIDIIDHAVEVGADATFTSTGAAASGDPGENRHGR
jgi:hypothetical protein